MSQEYHGLRYVDTVKDPIWAEIPLTDLERCIIETGRFARLRHVRQMGFAYLAFPGANHTRFEHSIGVMRASHMLFRMFAEIPARMELHNLLSCLRTAALLHDIGHPPFSHGLEEAFQKYPHLLDVGTHVTPAARALERILRCEPEGYSHEKLTAYAIGQDKAIRGLIVDAGLSFRRIKALAAGAPSKAGLDVLRPLIDGDFDGDKIDYILRDSYYCGLSHRFNLNEFRENLIFARADGQGKHRLVVLADGVPAIDSLLLARYKLTKEVHNSKRNRVATQMFVEKVRLWLEDLDPGQRAQIILQMHTQMTDHDLISELVRYERGPSIGDILDGKLYEQVLFFPFQKMHPAVKASTHIVRTSSPSIDETQQQLRRDFGDRDLILDIRESRPPKFETLVQAEEVRKGRSVPGPRTVFDYHTPLGILMDSLNDLAVYLYSPSQTLTATREGQAAVDKDTKTVPPFYFQYLDAEEGLIARRVVLAARRIRDLGLRDGTLIDIDLLMAVLAAVELFGARDIGRRHLWVYSDSALQSYMQKVTKACKEKGLKIEGGFAWERLGKKRDFSAKLFCDLARLASMGLVHEIRKPVPHPDQWSFRIDRRSSGWGIGYAETELGCPGHQVFDQVRRSLLKQKSSLKTIVDNEIIRQEHTGAARVSKRAPLSEDIRQLRDKLLLRRDLILTIG